MSTIEKKIVFTKRKKIILASLLLGILFFLTHYFFTPLWLQLVIGLVAVYICSLWSLDFDLKGLEYFFLPIIPILFYVSAVLAYPILEKLNLMSLSYPFLIIGMYVLLLTFNILNIATIRIIPLSRAAWVSLSISRFIISFFVYTYLFWFHFDWYAIVLFTALFTLFMTYPGLRLLIHQTGRGERSLYYILTITLCVTEVAFFIIFWQLPFFGAGLILSAIFYILMGFVEGHLKAQLNRGFFWEYGVVAIFTAILLFLL